MLAFCQSPRRIRHRKRNGDGELQRTWSIGVRLVDWAQDFGNRISGGILGFLRE
jgi:hypothetical protein